MKTTHKLTMVLVTAVMLGTAGCGGTGQRQSGTTTTYTDDVAVITDNIGGSVCNAGKLYYNYETQLLTFYDLKSEQAFPICDKINCQHSGSDCSAWFPMETISGYALYQGKIYYWNAPNDETILTLYRCDVNGSNRKCIYSCENDSQNTAINGIYINGKFYYSCYTKIPSLEEEMKNGYDPNAERALAAIDLASGKREILSESVSESSGRIEFLQDYDADGTLYYSRIDGDLYHDSVEKDSNFISTYFQFDPVSGKSSELLSITGIHEACIKNGFAYYIENTTGNILRINLENDETEIILSDGIFGGISVLDEKIVYARMKESGKQLEYFIWNPDSEESTKVENNLPDNVYLNVSYESQNAFWGYIADSEWTGNLRFFWISKEDFWNGQENYHVLTQG